MLPDHAELQSSRMKGQQEVPTLRFLQVQMARQLSPLLNARRIHDEHFEYDPVRLNKIQTFKRLKRLLTVTHNTKLRNVL